MADDSSRKSPGRPDLGGLARRSQPVTLDFPLPEGAGGDIGSEGEPMAPPLGADSQWQAARTGSRPEETRRETPAQPAGERSFQTEMPVRPTMPQGFNVPARIKWTVLPLPGLSHEPSLFSKIWFGLAFVLPVLLGAIYYLLIASNQYVCEFRFSVRQPVSDSTTSSLTNGLTSILQSSSPANPDVLDNYTVVDYVTSEQAARDLQARVGLKSMFNRSDIDFLSRFSSSGTTERLAKYWAKMSYSEFDPATGLAIVRVRAFEPSDAYRIASELLKLSNDLVNQIGIQSQKDSVRAAEMTVSRIEARVDKLRQQMTDLRLQTSTVDPTTSVVSGNAGLATTLRANIAQIESQITSLMQQTGNPNAPQIGVLKAQLNAAQKQLLAVSGEVSDPAASSNLARIAGEFEQATSRLQNEESLLLAAQNNLLQAQSSLDASRLYMTTYVSPSVPESSTYPNRLGRTAELMAVCAMIWIVGLLISNSIIEHAT